MLVAAKEHTDPTMAGDSGGDGAVAPEHASSKVSVIFICSWYWQTRSLRFDSDVTSNTSYMGLSSLSEGMLYGQPPLPRVLISDVPSICMNGWLSFFRKR